MQPDSAPQPAAAPSDPAPAVLTIDDVAYAIPPLTVPMAQLADEIDKHLQATRPDPFGALAIALTDLEKHTLPSAVKDRIQTGMIDRCLAESKDVYRHRAFDPSAVSAWLQSFDGGIWLLWRQLSQRHPDVPLAKVRTAVINQLAASASTPAPTAPAA